MRLIDADALKEAMNEHTDYKGYLVCDPEEIIDLAPTVEERPHGEWKTAYLDHVSFGVRPKVIYCSICNSVVSHKSNFCEECGADMREGDMDG